MSYDTALISEKYNGWSNYNTWLVNLWFSECFEDNIQRDAIKEQVEMYLDEVITTDSFMGAASGFLNDVIGSFMNEVNWIELEEHYVYPIERDEDEEFTPEDVYSSVA